MHRAAAAVITQASPQSLPMLAGDMVSEGQRVPPEPDPAASRQHQLTVDSFLNSLQKINNQLKPTGWCDAEQTQNQATFAVLLSDAA